MTYVPDNRILFLTLYDETGASSRYMVYQYLEHFRKAGFSVSVKPLIQGEAVYGVLGGLSRARSAFAFFRVILRIAILYLSRYVHVIQAWSYDLVVVQKDVLPLGLGWLLTLGQKNIVLSFDDPIWLGHVGSGGRVPFWGKVLTEYRKRLLIRLIRKSKLVLVDNPRMRKFVLSFNPRCEVLDSSVDIVQYRVAKDESGGLAFGWIGSPSTSHLLRDLIPELEKLAYEVPFKLYNIGSDPMTAKNFPIENISWSLKNEVDYLARFTVGLMPMDNDAFNQFRCSRKWLIYGCSEIPTLATDTELNRYCIEEGVTGSLYPLDRPDLFRKQAKELLLNKELRDKLGRQVYLKIVKDHSVDHMGQYLVKLVSDTFRFQRINYGDTSPVQK